MVGKELSALASPLEENQIQSLTQLTQQLSPLQQAWVSGYLAASASAALQATTYAEATTANTDTSAPTTAAQPTLTILYGSQTGNCKALAQTLFQQTQQQGVTSELVSMAEFNPRKLKDEQGLLVLVSTHGEGDPPDDAIGFYKFLNSKRAPQLSQLKYSVLALGDSSYEHFCQTGKDIDERLEQLGAKRLAPRQDCDLDYEGEAEQWQQNTVKQWLESLPNASSTAQVVSINPSLSNAVQTEQGYSAKAPVEAEVLSVQSITGRDSIKDIYHIELALPEGIRYQEGDSLGVWADNRADTVSSVLEALSLDGDEPVQLKGATLSLREALTKRLELTLITPPQLQKWAQLSAATELTVRIAEKQHLRAYIAQRDWLQVFREFPASVTAQQLVDSLRALSPRLYSIASSQQLVEEEVHLTVAQVKRDNRLGTHYGLASNYLADRIEEGQTVSVFVESNSHFKPSSDAQTPLIMIGPGTGIAPFRSFMQAREAQGLKGNTWLFFGNPNFEQDFLYQTEWQSYLKQGVLEKIDLAFSRDQVEKVYVQDRLLQQAPAVWQWLQQGAAIYVCGDAERMAKDVEKALLTLIAQQGQMTHQQAQDYLESLRSNHRYQKDVY
ncbi:assimilatory sulfite reductase (NADPH) flavoprotein subunit [Paraferrimonas haliotis]|nr:assimilatory sulfite reductase (NADPH) flavoprotein subunit [Paraferrimonas haliotis]